jgi:hypothetical protein
VTSNIPSSAIRLIRTEERSEQLAESMNFDDTRHSTATQSNPRPHRVSPIALGVLELAVTLLLTTANLPGCSRSAQVPLGQVSDHWALATLFSTMISIFRRPHEKHRDPARAVS